jgi:Flp pilus assembly protein TadD
MLQPSPFFRAREHKASPADFLGFIGLIEVQILLVACFFNIEIAAIVTRSANGAQILVPILFHNVGNTMDAGRFFQAHQSFCETLLLKERALLARGFYMDPQHRDDVANKASLITWEKPRKNPLKHSEGPVNLRSRCVLYLIGALAILSGWFCKPLAAQPLASVTVLTFSGAAEVSRREGVWDPAHTNQVLLVGDKMRTGQKSRAIIRLSDGTTMTIGAEASFEVLEPKHATSLNPIKGLFYFFHRDKPGELELHNRTTSAAVRGTEFHLEVAANGSWLLSVLDGAVSLQSDKGILDLKKGEAGLAQPGAPPKAVVMRRAEDLIQWCLEYPAVLDADELVLSESEQAVLKESLDSYRSGDLLAALARCPFGDPPGSGMIAIYRAELSLSVGQVDQAEELLNGRLSRDENGSRFASLKFALQELIEVVKGQPRVRSKAEKPETSTAWLAESYRLQSESKLSEARSAAHESVARSPQFAFAWEHLAELEFSFGNVKAARLALNKSLALAPRNAQAVSLKGFLLAADNRTTEAVRCFEEAIALDGAEGNAWLGRGLCRIRGGDIKGGKQDLLVAAALEPERAVFRSYLGKAFAANNKLALAHHELSLAEQLDPHDPSAWLYSSLLLLQENRINEAIAALEKSSALNENRSLFRSRFLLDQDSAVRSANLAAIYRDAGMNNVAVREATRAIEDDYSSYSAHLFLADSYNSLRDPRQVNLRYETPWLSEYLLANLLAPIGASTLSPMVSQQEYSRLFEQNRLGLASSTEYTTRGDWTQAAVQYGQLDSWGYGLEETYRSLNGDRSNDDLQQLTLSLRLKQQISPRDTIYLQTVYYNAKGGDLAPYYDPDSNANRTLRFKETQEPLLISGYHHEWAPGVHTLVLVGRLQDSLQLTNGMAPAIFLQSSSGLIEDATEAQYNQNYHSDNEIYVSEIQQLFQAGPHTLIFGARYQAGNFKVANQMSNGTTIPGRTPLGDPIVQSITTDFERFGFYAYDQWRPIDPLLIEGGISYDRVSFPQNYGFAPISSGQATRDRVGPKAGLVWTPAANTTVRAGYSRSLGGVSFDQSFRLEPSQVAGFNQAFRSLVPESTAGSVSAPPFDIYGLQLEQNFSTRTYFGITAGFLQSDADRRLGAVDFDLFPSVPTSNPYQPTMTRQSLNYDERSLSVSINQLLSDNFAFGVSYQLSRARLKETFPDIPSTVQTEGSFSLSQETRATLHQLLLYGVFNHPSGFFCGAEALWFAQDNAGYSPSLPGDDFWQFNLFGGYRWWRRRAEFRVALLNLTDQDYHLNPLNLTGQLPRQRTLSLSFRFSF